MKVEAMSEDFIRVRGLHKRFGQVTALDHLDLDIRKGEFFTLLGPSGCGKTTTLRLIGGLEKPDSGTIFVGGRCLASAEQRLFVNPEKRNMGMVFQSYALWPHMTVFENVAYPLSLRWVKKAVIRERVRAVLELLGLEGLESRPVPALSGGQQQRVALARALVFEPNVLLLDEPLSNLDAQLRDELRGELRSLQRRLGLTVILVTHDQIEALSVSGRIAIMNGGKLHQLGAPEEIYHQPATSFVRDFLGKIFALPGTVRDAAESTVSIGLTGLDESPLAVQRSHTVACDKGLAIGRKVVLAIRPEQIAIRPTRPDNAANVIRGRIMESQFLGDRHEYTIGLGAETRTLVLPAAQVFRPGETVVLELPVEKVTLWEP
jgi:ABC-type Fe3+/spermidine/putrescine transport system ATPase subunit